TATTGSARLSPVSAASSASQCAASTAEPTNSTPTATTPSRTTAVITASAMTLSGEVALLAVSSAIMPQWRWKARLRAYAMVMYASSISARQTSRYTAVAATAT